MVAEKRLSLRDYGGEVVEMQGLLAQELTQGFAFRRAKGPKPQMEADLLLVRRDGGLALRIGPLANKRAKFQVGCLIRPYSEIG